MTHPTIHRPFWRRPPAIAIAVVVALAVTFVVAQRWPRDGGNLLALLPIVLCFGMHALMHGGHGTTAERKDSTLATDHHDGAFPR
jgi:hypothetical protein